MWLAAALVLLMLVGGAAGFFIYRARQSRAVAELPAATPAPSVEPAPTTTTTAADVQVEEPKNANPNPDADKRVKQTTRRNRLQSRRLKSRTNATPVAIQIGRLSHRHLIRSAIRMVVVLRQSLVSETFQTARESRGAPTARQ